jgi:hypothetical protein
MKSILLTAELKAQRPSGCSRGLNASPIAAAVSESTPISSAPIAAHEKKIYHVLL